MATLDEDLQTLPFWDKLTDEQIAAFQKENPILAELKPVKLPRKAR